MKIFKRFKIKRSAKAGGGIDPRRIGGGGLGTLAIVKGLNIRKYDMMYSASLMLVFLVQFITVFGTRTTRSLDHKHR